MKIRLLFTACFIAVTCVCFAQNAEKIVIPSGRTILADMKINNPEMYSQYQTARKNQRTGIIMTGLGGGLTLIGAVFAIIPDSDNGTVTMGPYVFETNGDNSGLRNTGVVLIAAGVTCLSIGLPVMIIGKNKKKQIFQEFKNQYYFSQQPSSYLQMNIYPNRIGIAYNF